MADGAIQVVPDIVIAIDFGTSGTAFAFQLRSDFNHDPQSEIFDDPFMSERKIKTSTAILIHKERKVKSIFGNEAEEIYPKLPCPNDWLFFRHFKMQLYRKEGEETVSIQSKIKNERREQLDALTVLSESIGCIKETVEKTLFDADENYESFTKKWVITVPAIWCDGAKMLMRKAAEKAGIIGPLHTISIGFEPEGAAIYYAVSEANPQNRVARDGDRVLAVGPKTQNIIVDIGGGTVDITTVQVQENGTMKQVHKAEGGQEGGEMVDKKLTELVSGIFGKNYWTAFENDSSVDYLQFRQSVERAKIGLKETKPERTIIPDVVTLDMPEKRMSDWAKKTNDNNDDNIDKALLEACSVNLKEKVEIQDGRLTLEADILRDIMKKSVESILNYIKKVISGIKRKDSKAHISSVILVGGFSLSPFLFAKVKAALESEFKIQVKRPLSCNYAVVRGAVIFGQDEHILTKRILRMTYGIHIYKPFEEGDPENRKEIIGGKTYVKGVFKAHAIKEAAVGVDSWLPERTYVPLSETQKQIDIDVYTSRNHEPRYIDDKDCQCIGKFTFELDGKIQRKDANVSFNFGCTELKVRARHAKTKYEVIKKIGFKDEN